MPANADAWLARAKAVLSGHAPSEVVQSAISLLTAVYGPQSAQMNAFTTGLAQIAKLAPNPINSSHHQEQLAQGAIRNTIAEIEGGLIVSLRAQVAGEIFGELVGLGKETLEDDTDSAKNVSAVLIAAAFEDLMRRMGSELAGVEGRLKLEEVLTALKVAGVLKGGEVGTAQSYLKFRNDSLHADWAKVQKSQVQSCTAFIEALLVKHFS
ncbi:MAG: hypothetical protein JWO71_1701 [Candidatus Acidoferrum typicum]|nr:hypothetical protein [Candidatus Acidoferrum typicum]